MSGSWRLRQTPLKKNCSIGYTSSNQYSLRAQAYNGLSRIIAGTKEILLLFIVVNMEVLTSTSSLTDRVKYNLKRTRAAVIELEYRKVPIKLCRCLNAKTRWVAAAYFPFNAKRLKWLQTAFANAALPVDGQLYLDFVFQDGDTIVAGITELQPCFRHEMRNRILVTMDVLVDQLKLHIDCVQ